MPCVFRIKKRLLRDQRKEKGKEIELLYHVPERRRNPISDCRKMQEILRDVHVGREVGGRSQENGQKAGSEKMMWVFHITSTLPILSGEY